VTTGVLLGGGLSAFELSLAAWIGRGALNAQEGGAKPRMSLWKQVLRYIVDRGRGFCGLRVEYYFAAGDDRWTLFLRCRAVSLKLSTVLLRNHSSRGILLMFFLLQHGEEAAHAAEAAHGTEQSAEHVADSRPDREPLFRRVGLQVRDAVHVPEVEVAAREVRFDARSCVRSYTPENAIPWYTVMFLLACIITVALIWIMKGRLSEDEPGGGQQTLEAGVLAVRSMLEDIVGPHGLQYFRS
jgi:hypothetical protein